MDLVVNVRSETDATELPFRSFTFVSSNVGISPPKKNNEVQMWLSATLTNQDMRTEGLANVAGV